MPAALASAGAAAGRPPKKPKLTPGDVGSLLLAQRGRAKQYTLALLQRCLDSHLLPSMEVVEYLNEISNAVGTSADARVQIEVDEDADEETDRRSEAGDGPPSGPGRVASKKHEIDEHNEVCEVCELGGDLICCDTCSLVFHLGCLRPKLAAVPKGDWSCPYCVLDDAAQGDKAQAKLAIKAMNRLTRGFDSDDEQAANSDGDQRALRMAKTGEITVAHSGRKFIVRRTAKKQIVELGRYSTLEEALKSVGSVQTAARRTSKGSSRANEEEELWCTHCLDDPAIGMCAFCGCKECFGKYDAGLLVLCDECDRETHAYCLHPPQSSVPSADPWYCESCAAMIPATPPPADAEAPNSAEREPRGRGRPSKRKDGELVAKRAGKLVKKRSRSAGSTVGSEADGGDASEAEDAPTLADLIQHVELAAVRAFSEEDLQAMEYFRSWASIPDLHALLKALMKQQQQITARLQAGAAGPGAAASSGAGAGTGTGEHDVALGEHVDFFKEGLELDLGVDHKSRPSDASSIDMHFPELACASQDPGMGMPDDHFLLHSTSPDMLLGFKDDDDMLLSADHLEHEV